ncbi:hypothetical protein DPMN_048323 [Dreissena polymorpha]|uniref:Uncharacterized protein n=1 Tax=Dreissena polymorpha TaxID=45954 RepID=A0A9D4D9S2_DREPO|nr:hypothetical protein DPMN_048323 [Dreissena polymorpha]
MLSQLLLMANHTFHNLLRYIYFANEYVTSIYSYFLFSFSSVDELNQFVLAVHGEGAYVQVAQVTVKLPEAKRLSKVFHEHG